MDKDMLLMMKDIPVMEINLNTGVYTILNNNLLPFTMKDRFRFVDSSLDLNTQYGRTQLIIALNNNHDVVVNWLANRVLLLSRANAKWIYNAIGIEQLDSNEEKAKFSVLCRSVSLLDSYWLKFDSDDMTWDDVDIRKNPLNETIAQIALHGKSLTLQGSILSPELTTHGAYAKAWRRYSDGSLWLHKLGAHGNTESRIEVMCSNLLDKMNVDHVRYIEKEDDGKYVCACPCITTEDLAILDGIDFNSYCNTHGINPDKEMLRIDADSIYKMWQVDYLISNRDRHGQNWGFYYDVNTMKIIKCHPLFDHNNAFDTEFMKNKDAKYQFCGRTIKQAAIEGHKHAPIELNAPITREDFITDRQFESFMDRANDIGLCL